MLALPQESNQRAVGGCGRPPLSAREREVLALVAEGHSNAAAARLLSLTEAGVAKHIGNVLTKLNLPVSDDTNRRVLAVLAYLRTRSD